MWHAAISNKHVAQMLIIASVKAWRIAWGNIDATLTM
jgi:hypothetical protein